MDLVELIRKEIDALPTGDHLIGLQSVLQHIEVAFRHLGRGHDSKDETAFTDAIYRTNQAFEGGIKEAYRVLAEKDPYKETPYNIEKYLEKNSVFKDRVLSQFRTYRTDWRNPSAHDYNLRFDENEAFLAIVSVAAFAKLVIDQISSRLASDEVKSNVKLVESAKNTSISQDSDLTENVSKILSTFFQQWSANSGENLEQSEYQLIGSIVGFLSLYGSDLEVKSEYQIHEGSRRRSDIAVSRKGERTIVEITRAKIPLQHISLAIRQLIKDVHLSDSQGAILCLVSDSPSRYVQYKMNIDYQNIYIVIPDSLSKPYQKLFESQFRRI